MDDASSPSGSDGAPLVKVSGSASADRMPSGERLLAVATRLAVAARVPPVLLDELHRLHARQWRLEDETRLPGTSSASVAAAKAEIDQSNARRHQIIDLIDAAMAQPELVQPCRYYSETIGELCDRLLILDLKHQELARANTSVGVPRVALAWRHMSTVVTQLIDDLAAGRAVLPPRVGVKIYNGSPSLSDMAGGAGGTESVKATSTVGG